MNKYRNGRSAGYRRKERPELQWLEDGVNTLAGSCAAHSPGLVMSLCKLIWNLCGLVVALLNIVWIFVRAFMAWRVERRTAALLANTSVKPVLVSATVIRPKTLPVKIRRLRSTPTCITLVAHKRLG